MFVFLFTFFINSEGNGYASHMSRLSSLGWSADANEIGQWIMIDLEKVGIINKVVTQGHRSEEEWITSYSLCMCFILLQMICLFNISCVEIIND